MACQEFLSGTCSDPKPQVITDEIVSNSVRCSGSPDFDVDIELPDVPAEVRLVFADRGSPFDPTRTADPDLSAPVADRQVGGLGLYMVRKMSRLVAYERRGDENVLTVVIAR